MVLWITMVDLSWLTNQTDIEIDLDVVDFSEYKSRVYRLLGLEDEWMEVPADHKIVFLTFLRAGILCR